MVARRHTELACEWPDCPNTITGVGSSVIVRQFSRTLGWASRSGMADVCPRHNLRLFRRRT